MEGLNEDSQKRHDVKHEKKPSDMETGLLNNSDFFFVIFLRLIYVKYAYINLLVFFYLNTRYFLLNIYQYKG